MLTRTTTIDDFAMWLTARPGTLKVGARETVYPMLEALQEFKSMLTAEALNWVPPAEGEDRSDPYWKKHLEGLGWGTTQPIANIAAADRLTDEQTSLLYQFADLHIHGRAAPVAAYHDLPALTRLAVEEYCVAFRNTYLKSEDRYV